MDSKLDKELEKQFELCVNITETLAAELQETSLNNQPIDLKNIGDNIDDAEVVKMKPVIYKKMRSLSVPLALMIDRREDVVRELGRKLSLKEIKKGADPKEHEDEKKPLKDFKIALEQSIRKEQLSVLESPEMNEYLELLKISEKTMAFLKMEIYELSMLEECVREITKDNLAPMTPSGQPIHDHAVGSGAQGSLP